MRVKLANLLWRTAIGLATESQAQLRIVHVVDTANINIGAELADQYKVSASLVDNAQKILNPAERIADAAGVAAEASLITIDALNKRIPEAITEDAEAWSADLIVIGTHGRRGFTRLLLGSVAEGVARLATKPVLLVRGK
jgi:nucleotide-binding universal stress UspA family protein